MRQRHFGVLVIASAMLVPLAAFPAAGVGAELDQQPARAVVSESTPLDAERTAAQLDALLAHELLGGASSEAAPRCDDATFLRRAMLDLTGQLPTAAEVRTFVADAATDKRSRLIQRLLDQPEFGENWGGYWRDVIMYRRTDERGLLASQSALTYLTDAINANTPWDEIARAFITATGDVRENGATAIVAAQMGNTEDFTAEVSRIFLGIQISCAQCHDHPTDRWRREQFHELAAFFPRLALRPVRDGEQRSLEVVGVDRPRMRRPNNNQPQPSAEHYMSDLDNPAARGTLMQPVFFVTGQKLGTGVRDARRRETAAQWITSPDNPWFARAVVNRIWAELVGEGFYEPIDDLGPDRTCSAPQTLDALAAAFVTQQHDLKWLYRAIMATEAYQRSSRSRRNFDGTPFAANCLQPLRADQLVSALSRALGGAVSDAGTRRFQMLRGARGPFTQLFGYDPSLPRDEITGTIPQALLLMNGPQIAASINGRRPNTALGRLLAAQRDNRAATVELYLRSLGREPTQTEVATCLTHVRRTGDRIAAFEDIQWALINSAEFLHRK